MSKLELERDALPMDSSKQAIVKVPNKWLNQTKCSESAPGVYIASYSCQYMYLVPVACV